MTKIAWEYHFNRLPKGVTDSIIPRNLAHELRNLSQVLIPRAICNRDNIQFDISLCKYINALDITVKYITNRRTLLNKLKKQKLLNYRDEVTCNYLACHECSLI